MFKAAHQRKFDVLVFWALDRLTREGTRATLNYLQRLESKGVDYVSYQGQWLDSTGPFKDVMISIFATLAKQERARISERTIAGLKIARAKGKRLGRPPVPEATIRTVLALRQENGIGARRIAKSTGFPLGTVSAILSRGHDKLLSRSREDSRLGESVREQLHFPPSADQDCRSATPPVCPRAVTGVAGPNSYKRCHRYDFS
jgi:DNA invertase Pin-like site-specific DNA recombinase